MKQQPKKHSGKRRAASDIMHGLRELAAAMQSDVPLRRRFTVRTVRIPEPRSYSAARVKKLRASLGMSQAVFADLLGVSRIWVQGWERGVRQPSTLARRLLDTIAENPSKWMETVWKKAS